jgi:hypothetical protein
MKGAYLFFGALQRCAPWICLEGAIMEYELSAYCCLDMVFSNCGLLFTNDGNVIETKNLNDTVEIIIE